MNTSLPTIDLREIPRRILPAYGTSEGTLLSIAPFLALTRELSALLVPMRPRPAFRAELHRSLVTDARRQQAQVTLTIAPPPADSALGSGLTDRMAHLLALPSDGEERYWAVGAAAVGGAVSLGILAYLLRHRDRTAAAA